MPAPHPVEFRRRAVELARVGDRPIAVLAKELRISESCLRNWIAQADTDDGGRTDRITTAEKKELAELRRRNRLLEMENEILKRAARISPGRTSSQSDVPAGPRPGRGWC